VKSLTCWGLSGRFKEKVILGFLVFSETVDMSAALKLETRSQRLSNGQLGLALLSILLFSAIISIISVSAAKLYLANTQNIHNQTSSIQSKLLHQAGLRYAIFDILKERSGVAIGGVPNTELVYQTAENRVLISVQNEAAFLDLNRMSPELLDSVLRNLGVDTSFIPRLKSSVLNLKIDSFRKLKRYYINDPSTFESIISVASFYNGASQINRDTAPLQLLAALPDMNSSQVDSIRVERENTSERIVSDSFVHPLVSSRASNHYRITTRVFMGLTSTVRTHIVKVDPSENDFHKIIASL